MALVIAPSAAPALTAEIVPMPRPCVWAALGCILTAYGYILARHVTRLLSLQRIIGRPGEVSGQVTMAHPYALALSL
jgi:hypothetical protein